MRRHLYQLSFLASLLVLAACESLSPSGSSPTSPTPAPTSALPPVFLLYTSSTFQIAYPSGWTPKSLAPPTMQIYFVGQQNQLFGVRQFDPSPGQTPAQLVTAVCQAMQPSSVGQPVPLRPVQLSGQDWTQGDCAAGNASSFEVVVDVILYQGAGYQLDYGSATAQFQRDDGLYYGPMEQSFQFLK